MAKFGKLFRTSIGRKPKEISVRKISFQKPQRQTSLDQALKRANKEMQVAKQQKGERRRKALSRARKILQRIGDLN